MIRRLYWVLLGACYWRLAEDAFQRAFRPRITAAAVEISEVLLTVMAETPPAPVHGINAAGEHWCGEPSGVGTDAREPATSITCEGCLEALKP